MSNPDRLFITSHFSLNEFSCRDGSPVPDFLRNNLFRLCINLEKIRNKLSVPIVILSGYRTKKYNTLLWEKDHSVSLNSQHLLAKAADFKVYPIKVKSLGCTVPIFPQDIYFVLEQMIDRGELEEGGLGLYNTFIHYDIRGYKARWNYQR